MSGKILPGIIDTAMADVYEENLKYAVKVLEAKGMVGLIEPISRDVVPNYFMNSFETGQQQLSLCKLLIFLFNESNFYLISAVEIIKKIDSKSLKLQLDVFHLQLLKGNLTKNITELLPHTGKY